MDKSLPETCCVQCRLDGVDRKDCLCQYTTVAFSEEAMHLLDNTDDTSLFDLDVPMPNLLSDIDLHLECDDDSLYAFSPASPKPTGFFLPKKASERGVSFKVTFPQEKQSGEDSSRSSCSFCNRSFTRLSLLKDHLFRLHKIESLHYCPKCSYKANMHRHLQKHVKRLHPDYVRQLAVAEQNDQLPNLPSAALLQDTNSSFDKTQVKQLHVSGELAHFDTHPASFMTTVIALPHEIPVTQEVEVKTQPYIATNVEISITDQGNLSKGSVTTEFDDCTEKKSSEIMPDDLSSFSDLCLLKDTVCDDRNKIDSDIDMTVSNHSNSRQMNQLTSSRPYNPVGTSFHIGLVVTEDNSAEATSTSSLLHEDNQESSNIVPSSSKYQCPVCQKTMPTKYHLHRHQKSHSDERPFMCIKVNCHRTFKNQSALNEHILTVHGKKCHECSYPNCSKAYTVMRDLKAHEAVHLQLYECDWPNCGKTFRDGYNLKTHYQTHTKEKNYSCTDCSYTCIQKITLQKHQKRRHQKVHRS